MTNLVVGITGRTRTFQFHAQNKMRTIQMESSDTRIKTGQMDGLRAHKGSFIQGYELSLVVVIRLVETARWM